jgi:hypothetical protein
VPHRPVPNRHRLMGDQTDASGRTGRTPVGWTLDGWTPARPDAGSRTMSPGDWTPGGPDRRAPDDGTGWVDTACWTRTGDRRHGWRPGTVEHGDGACPLDARWTLGWAGASGRATNQDSSGARTTRASRSYGRGLTTATTDSCSSARRPSRASAHCCRVLDLDGTRRGQWDEGKLRCAGSGW